MEDNEYASHYYIGNVDNEMWLGKAVDGHYVFDSVFSFCTYL